MILCFSDSILDLHLPIEVLFLNFHPQQIPKKELLDMIDKAIASDQYFFIGIFPVNKETGMAKDALYECEGRTVDQMGAFTSSNHPIDKIAKDKMQLQLIKTFYTEELKLKKCPGKIQYSQI